MDPRLYARWFLIRGSVAFLFGLTAFLFPSVTARALTLGFGVYAILGGLLDLTAPAWRVRAHHVIEGLLGIGAGTLALLWPEAFAHGIVLFLGAWAVLVGLLHLVAHRHFRRMVGPAGDTSMIGLAGIVALAFGAFLLLWPRVGIALLVGLVGFYALVYGAAALWIAVKVRRSLPPFERPRHA